VLEDLIAGCIRNDRTAQEKLYRALYEPLYCMCRRYFRNEHEAIEAVNDGMLKVFSHIADFDGSKGKFFNWVYTIVRRSALDKLKQSGALAFTDVLPSASFVAPSLDLTLTDMYRLLDSLSPSTRVVCSLFYLEDYPIRDIASLLGISTGTVKWHLSESRRKLRVVFEKHYL
jgi:DNA-directed RNA polymerase specialized sigma24 family protein